LQPGLEFPELIDAASDRKQIVRCGIPRCSAVSRLATRCQSYSGPWSGVRQALFAAGEFRIHRFQVGARPAVLAIRGEWTFSDDEAITDIQKAVGIVREFWHDDNFPYFLVTLKPFDNDSGQGDGSAFTNAFCRREGTR
jgi:hypothetical protein